jgi:hypothetical protein
VNALNNYVLALRSWSRKRWQIAIISALITAGTLLSFLAVGCPVCNKIALIALGYTGAIKYFAPIQPFLALFGIAILIYALSQRLKGEINCKILVK